MVVKTWENGDVYNGDMKETMRHGKGEFKDAEGYTFNGDWVDDNLVKGTYEGPDGKYDGEWDENIKVGKGCFEWEQGDKYDGEWADDSMNGEGSYTFSNGRVYTGQYEDGIRCGFGKLVRPDGAVYEGGWFNDKCNGKGKYEDKFGKYSGDWMDNMKHGRGTWDYPSGHVFDGNWKMDKKVGVGFLWAPGNASVTKQEYDDAGNKTSESPSTPEEAMKAMSTPAGGAAPGLAGDSLPAFDAAGNPIAGGAKTDGSALPPGLAGDALPAFDAQGNPIQGQSTGPGGAAGSLSGDDLPPGLPPGLTAQSGDATGPGGAQGGLSGDALPPGVIGYQDGKPIYANNTGPGGAQGQLSGDDLPPGVIGYVDGQPVYAEGHTPDGKPGPTQYDVNQLTANFYLNQRGGGRAADAKKVWSYDQVIPYDELRMPGSKWTRPEIDVVSREKYLSDSDFQEQFGMDKGSFEKVPLWKRNVMKRRVNLY